MAFIRKNGIWRPNQVPPGPVEIDYSHPLARGIKVAALGRAFRDDAGCAGLITGNNGVFPGRAMDIVTWKNGSAYFFFNSPYMYRPVSGIPHFPLTITMASAQRISGGGGSTIISAQGGGNIGWSLAINGLMTFTVHGVADYNSSALAYDTDLNLGLTWDGSTITFYKDGLSIGSVATGAGTANSIGNLLFGVQGGGGDQYYGYANGLVVRSALFNAAEMERAAREPFAFVRPRISRQLYFLSTPIGGGGTVYNVGITEGGSAAETLSDVATLPSAVNDNASAADAPASTAVLPSAVAEAPSAVDAPASTAVLPSAVAEAGGAADAPASTAVLPSVVAEAGNAQDTDSSNNNLSAIVESAAAQDTVSSTLVGGAAVSEAGSATDSRSSSALLPAAVVEAGALVDVLAAQVAFMAALVEVGIAVDLPAALAILNSGVIEAGTAVDSPSASAPNVTAAKCNTLSSAPRVRALGSAPRIRLLGGDCC